MKKAISEIFTKSTKISRSATRANTIALKISPSTCARNAAILRTSRSGCNAALITPQYGATLIRQAITRRSMGISSGIERSGATRFSFGLRPADPAAGLFSTPEYVVLLHRLRQMTR